MLRFLNITFLIAVTFLLFTGCSDNRSVNELLLEAKSQAVSNDWDEALKNAQKAVDKEPQNIDALLFTAIAADRCNENALAVDSATKAYKINSNNFITLYTLGSLYAKDPRRYSEAMPLLEKALTLKKNDRNTLVLLTNVTADINPKKSLLYLTKLSYIDGALVDTEEFNAILGYLYWKLNLVDRSSKSLSYALRLNQNNPINYYNFAIVYDFGLNKSKSVLQYYRKFVQNSKNNPELAPLVRKVEARMKVIENL